MTDIDNIVVIDLFCDSAIVIWPHDNAPDIFQKFNKSHIDGDNSWIVFVPSDMDYGPFFFFLLAETGFMFEYYGGSKVIVYKENI